MRIKSLIIILSVLGISCSSNESFNILSAEINIDTLDVRLKLDSFQLQMNNLLLEKVDTSDFSSAMETMTDSVVMANWLQESAEFGIGYFDKIFKEMSKPNIVKDINRETVHFLIITNNYKDYLELEISESGFLFTRNKGEVQFKEIDTELWNRAKNECACNDNDTINDILANITGKNIYRIDITVNGTYTFCWKELKENDILNQLLEETRK